MTFFRPSGVARFVGPIEPSADRRAEARIAVIDEYLAAIAAVPPPVRTPQMWAEQDRLLDERFALSPVDLRPSVPVIPGRPS